MKPQKKHHKRQKNNGKKYKETGKFVRVNPSAAGAADDSMVQYSKSQTSRPQPGVANVSMKKRMSYNKHSKGKNLSSILDGANSLHSRMMERLNAARFRYINEQMYTSTSKEASDVFSTDPAAFKVYHSGYQQQLAKWPVQPVDVIGKQLRNKSKSLVVADFGCGDARLAQNAKQKVHSFDLHPLNDKVIKCDMAHVPLDSESVDIAVFCLSLMGSNITDFLLEAHRVLKPGGIMKIAEVQSRFGNLKRFMRDLERLGFSLVGKDETNKMFILLDFVKSGRVKNKKIMVKLAPCLYKKR